MSIKCSPVGGGLVVINKPIGHNLTTSVAPFKLRNVEKSSDFDPVTKQQIFRLKESSQWEHPVGPNQFHQYSKVFDEKSTFAPSAQQKEQGTFEFFTSKCGDTRTGAIRSEQKFQEVRHLSDDGGGGGKTRKSSSIRLVTTVQSFSTTTKYSQDVTTVSDLKCCPPSDSLPSCGHSNGNSGQQNKDWELDIASLEKITVRLDNSAQIEKKNLSKNGSLSRRRRPTRSNLKGIMPEFFNNGEELSKPIENQILTENKVNGTSDRRVSNDNDDEEIYEKQNLKPVVIAVNTNKNTKTNFNSLKNVFIQKCIEIPKEKLLISDAGEATRCGWLQEAKQKLRKCHHSLPVKVNGQSGRRQRQNAEDYLSKVFRMNGQNGTYVSAGAEPTVDCDGSKTDNCDVQSEYNDNSGRNCNVVTSTSEMEHYDYPDINRNRCDDSVERTGPELFGYASDSDSEECATVVENLTLSSVLQKSECVPGVHLDVDAPPEPTVVVSSLLEKNKSKSTSNLDDDETMEAPWFQHPTYQKPSRVADAMREFAKSSADLKFVSSEHVNESHGVELCKSPILEESVEDFSCDVEQEEQRAPWMREVKLKSISGSARKEELSKEVDVRMDGGVATADTAYNVSQVTVNGGSVTFSTDFSKTEPPNPHFSTESSKHPKIKASSELYSNSWSSMCHDNVVIVANDRDERRCHNKNTVGQKVTPTEFSTKINVCGSSVVSGGSKSQSSDARESVEFDCNTREANWLRGIQLRKVVTKNSAELCSNGADSVGPFNGTSDRCVSSSPICSMRFDEESDDDERRSPLERHKRWVPISRAHVEDRFQNGGGPVFKYRLRTDLPHSANNNNNEEVVVTGNSVDATTWQKLEKLELKKTTKANDGQQPEWIKEAEEKRKSWLNLSALESPPHHTASTGSRASWLDEVKLKRTDTTKVSISDVDTESEGWSPVPPARHSPSDVDTEDCVTSWKFVRSKSTDGNRASGRLGDVEEPESEESQVMTIEDASIDDDTSEDLSTSIKSSDRSQETCDSRNRSRVEQAETPPPRFDVESYVKKLISRRRANKDLQRRPADNVEQQSENPEWLQISKEKSKNVDWSSLEKSTAAKKSDTMWSSDVGCRKSRPRMWPSVEKSSSSDSEDATTEETCRSRETGSNSSLKSPSSSSSSSSPQWVSQVHLNSCGSTVRVGAGDSTIESRSDKHSSIMSKLTPNDDEDSTTRMKNSDTHDTEWRQTRKKNGHKGDKCSKRVTFDIPKAQSSPDLQRRNADGDCRPEWVRIAAEKKCHKEINWECLDSRQETFSKLTSENKWITQVQLRHVDTKSFDEGCGNVAVEWQPPHGVVTVNGQHHGEDMSEEEEEKSDYGCPAESSSPDWLKVAELKKQARISWQQLVDTTNDDEVPNSSPLGVSPTALEKGAVPELDIQSGHLLPSWLHVAEKKKKSSIDWTNIERDMSIRTLSSSTSSKVEWIRKENATSSSESSICDDQLGKNPFHVSLRHVQQEKHIEDELIEEADANVVWPTRNGGRDVDRWQVLYKDLFEDLLDESLSAPSAALRLSHSESIDEVHMLGSCRPEKSNKSKKLPSTLESRQRKRNDLRQHRYYSLPEISRALPRDGREVEIIQLPAASIEANREEEEETLDRTNATQEDEEIPIVFVKLRPTDRKKNEQIAIHEEEEEEESNCWLSRVKLRKTTTTRMESSSSGSTEKDRGGGVRDGQHRFPKSSPSVPPKTLAGNRYSGFSRTRMCSSPSGATASSLPSSPLHSIREAIHRDIREEVARRETRKVADVPRKTVSPVKEVATETTAQDIGFLSPSKPKWLVELQQKKETSRRAFLTSVPSNGSSVAASKHLHLGPSSSSSSPTFVTVVDQIRSMGKEKLFANLRKCPVEESVPLDGKGAQGPEASIRLCTTMTLETETTGCTSKPSRNGVEKNGGISAKCGSIAASRSDGSATMETFCGSIVDMVHPTPINFSSSSSISSSPTCTASDVSDSPSKREDSSRHSNNNKSAPLMVKKHFECQVTAAKQLVNSRTADDTHLKEHCSSNVAQTYSVTSKFRSNNDGSVRQEIVITNGKHEKKKKKTKSPVVADKVSTEQSRRRNTIEFVSTSSVTDTVTSFDEELKSPVLLMNLMSRLNKSRSDTNLNRAGASEGNKESTDRPVAGGSSCSSSSSSSSKNRAAISCSDLSRSAITVKTFDSIRGEQLSKYKSEMSFSVAVPEGTALKSDANEVASIGRDDDKSGSAVDPNDFDLKLTTKCVYNLNSDTTTTDVRSHESVVGQNGNEGKLSSDE